MDERRPKPGPSREDDSLIRLWRDGLSSADPLVLVATATALLVLLFASGEWHTKLPLRALCVLALLQPKLLRRSELWFGIVALQFSGLYYTWFRSDNHQYLMAYWCLALFLTFAWTKDDDNRRKRELATAGRRLIAMCMLIAVLAKLRCADYVDGSFFVHELMCDPRFSWVAETFAGLSSEQLANARGLDASLRQGAIDHVGPLTVRLQGTSALWCVAHVLTWWTVAIETLLGLLFVVPRTWSRGFEHGVLLAFVASTYAVASVTGFGWLLLVMGLAQCGHEHLRLRSGYLVLFALLLVYSGDWSGISGHVGGWIAGGG